MSRLMRPPRSPSLPSAAVGQQLRAHPGEDNGTRTRTPALTTRRLSLRLCPPQNGPRGGTRTSAGMVGSRGFEPRSARSERAASANCATSRKEWSEWRDSNPHFKAWKARGQPLPHIRSGSARGLRTSTSRPNMDRCRSPAHRQLVSCQRPRSCELGGRQGIRTQPLPWGRTGLRPVSGPSARTARCDFTS